MTTIGPGEHLTTSRISRLFRPLRAKCNNLASLPVPTVVEKSKSAVPATYATTSRPSVPTVAQTLERPPLVVIPPPEKLASRAQLDRFSRSILPLSKNLYSVRDAFRNLVQVTLGSASSSGSRKGNGGSRMGVEEEQNQGRVRSLAAMCAMTIGELVEAQVQISLEEKEEDEELHEEEEMEIIHDLYEAIPPQYRRHAVISHALDIIFTVCPPNHTLLEILLDVTLSHNLRDESSLILRRLLAISFQPLAPGKGSSADPPPVAHPAHSRYLANLLDACCQAHNGALFNERAFTRIMCETLVETPSTSWTEAWTCKATIYLARTLQSRDYPAFLSLVSCLQHSIARLDAEQFSEARSELAEIGETRLKARLAKWLSNACRRIHGLSSSFDDCGAEEARVVSRLVVEAEAMGMFDPLCTDPDSLSSVLVCLATLFMGAPLAALLSSDVRAQLLAALRRMSVNAKSHAFDTLVLIAMPQESKSEGNSSLLVANLRSTTIPAIRNWARTLRNCSCQLLEASLWASAVHHIEVLPPEAGSHYDPACHNTTFAQELQRLTAELVSMGEEAERCLDGVARQLTTQTPRRRTLQDGEWRWDDMFDCFVQKTPACVQSPPKKAAKRRYTDDVYGALSAKRTRVLSPGTTSLSAAPRMQGRTTELASLPSSRASSVAAPAPASLAPRASSSRSSTTPRPPSPGRASAATSTSSGSSASSRLATPTDDQENLFFGGGGVQTATAPARTQPSRRTSGHSNFTSILRDAQMNTVVLHPQRPGATASRRAKVARPQDPLSSRASPVSDQAEDVEVLADGAAFDAEDPSSDDVLDLFQYDSNDF